MVVLNPGKCDEGFGIKRTVPWSDRERGRGQSNAVATFTEMSLSQYFPKSLKDGQRDTYHLICLTSSELFFIVPTRIEPNWI